MAFSDPISESTPKKRRKLDNGSSLGWNSEDDNEEDFTLDDFHTIATLPVGTQQHEKKLQYTHVHPTNSSTFTTQPTQALSATPHILVGRSSPTPTSSSPKAPLPPPPIRKAFSKPSLIATAIAPPGTSFRAPLGIQLRPSAVQIDSDDDDPLPRRYSSDEGETQGMRSNLKPTNFLKGGRGLDSTPNRRNVVQESPRPAPAMDTFRNIMSEFSFKGSNDLASAYGNVRRSKPAVAPIRPRTAVLYNTLHDVDDYVMEKKIIAIQDVFPSESVQRCYDALIRSKGNVDDAKNWLLEDIAVPNTTDTIDLTSSSPVRPAAKQSVNAPVHTIAERYGRSQALQPKADREDHRLSNGRGRLIQGRKSARSSLSPHSSPAPSKIVQPTGRRKVHVIEDDSDDSEVQEVESADVSADSPREVRLLQFFNECSIEDLVDVTAQTKEVVEFVISKRPFDNLEVIRAVALDTKSGKSRSRPIGDKMVDLCSDMWAGYDAVDQLVTECERLALPIQEALKGWGVGVLEDGELQLTQLEGHDSGIGTPSSTAAADDEVRVVTGSGRSKNFLGQPASMNQDAELRLKDYQLVALNWLNLLWSKRMSCILADDMGLGKTCQVIAFLAHLQDRKVDGIHLVIVPGSVLENWLREFERFAPKLKVVPYYGSQKERPELQEQIEADFSIDVIVTTIDMAVKPGDNKFLRRLKPLVCICDEAHALRNANSDRYRQLEKIGRAADFRILLTGTPLQNNLQELVALLAFMMSELFSDKMEDLRYIFQHKATTKDAADSSSSAALLSTQRIARARSMMTPFVLRRKKEQVLELPTKTQHLEYCAMTATQNAYYNELVREFQTSLTASGPQARRTGSNILMALRKAAIHPLLSLRLYTVLKIDEIVVELMKHPEFADNGPTKTKAYLTGERSDSFKGGDYGLHRFCTERPYLRKFELKKRDWMKGSGKIDKFQELISGFVAHGDRALVFSQFTTMMDILEAVLESMNVRFMRLDGSTSMDIRQTMIDRFTKDTSITVFMLSTKAGGAGINLACANKVIIFDSGFNPQEDIQAENRAHRVGQTRPVDVYRLITRGTIEEQIRALHESKLELGERVAEDASEASVNKAGEDIVKSMLLEDLQKEHVVDAPVQEKSAADLKDAFRDGLESKGVKVASKQAQF